jgi:hypothetical protein
MLEDVATAVPSRLLEKNSGRLRTDAATFSKLGYARHLAVALC